MTMEEFAVKMKVLGALHRKGLRQATDKARYIVLEAAKRKVSGEVLNVISGRGKASVTSKLRARGAGYEGIVGSDVFYMLVHEFGKIIRAVRKPFMVFYYKGKLWRVKQVTIPRRPWLQPSLDENRSKILRCFDEEVGEAIIKAGLA